jgi:hypothetical protein
MANVDPLATKPFRGPVPSRRGLDRLEVIPVNPAAAGPRAASPPDLLAPEEAVSRLTRAGLACARAKGPRLHILGGTSAVVDRDIHGYANAFSILGEPGGRFTVLVSGGPRRDDEETSARTLSEAVDVVTSIYRARGAL